MSRITIDKFDPMSFEDVENSTFELLSIITLDQSWRSHTKVESNILIRELPVEHLCWLKGVQSYIWRSGL